MSALRKKELKALLSQAAPAPDLETRLAKMTGEMLRDAGEAPESARPIEESYRLWRLPDGRIIDTKGGSDGRPADLWQKFEGLEDFHRENVAFALEIKRALASQSEAPRREGHALGGLFREDDLTDEGRARSIGELFATLGAKRDAVPLSDREVARLSRALKRAWRSHSFDEADMGRTIVFVTEAVRARTSSTLVVERERGALVPRVRTPRGVLLDPWLSVHDAFYDGDVPDLKAIVDMHLASALDNGRDAITES